MNLDFAVNTTKLRRIMDKMPNASQEQIKAEYIKNGGLIKNQTQDHQVQVAQPLKKSSKKKQPVKITKKVKEVVKKAVKKVTKKK